jgi:hypothetical protein
MKSWGKPDPKPTKNLLAKMDKKTSVKKLTEELDTVFSIFIRKRHADEKGLVSCFTCGKIDHWKNMHAGHYFSRRYFGTRWHEVNVQNQCPKCNLYNQGAGPQFAVKLVKEHGPEILETLTIDKNRVMKVEAFNLKLLINHYKSLIK